MSATDDLLKQAQKLYDEKKYQEVINLLTGDDLSKYKRADLYELRGRAYDGIKEYEKAIVDYTAAIELEPDNKNFYYRRAYTLDDNKEYDKAIADYTKAIELYPKFDIAFNDRGVSWFNVNEPDKALADFNKAIELDPNYPYPYLGRGNVWNSKQDYDKAILDYDKVLELDPNSYFAYNGRGNAWSNKQEYDKAVADYNKALELNPNFLHAYNGRGNAWSGEKEYDKAIADYNKAIEIDPNYTLAISNRGLLYEFDLKDYKKALGDYEAALAKGTVDERWKYRRDAVSKKIKDEEEQQRQNKTSAAITQLSVRLSSAIDGLLQYAIYSIPESTVHYTKLSVAEVLITEKDIADEQKGRLRYYNAIYMNDPTEGETVFDCFRDGKKIRDAFAQGQMNNETSVYLGSFLSNKRDLRQDELVMWLTYGKGENLVEAAGCSLIISPDFFDRMPSAINSTTGGGAADGSAPKGDGATPYRSLYKVFYYKGGDYAEDGDKLKPLLGKIEDAICEMLELRDKGGMNPKQKEDINSIIFNKLIQICYLFKSSDYDFEHEVRVIQHLDPRSPSTEIYMDTSSPPKLYTVSDKKLLPYLNRIFIGPKADRAQQWQAYLDQSIRCKAKENKEKYKVQIKLSACRYR